MALPLGKAMLVCTSLLPALAEAKCIQWVHRTGSLAAAASPLGLRKMEIDCDCHTLQHAPQMLVEA